jgi:hypothetical protein
VTGPRGTTLERGIPPVSPRVPTRPLVAAVASVFARLSRLAGRVDVPVCVWAGGPLVAETGPSKDEAPDPLRGGRLLAVDADSFWSDR